VNQKLETRNPIPDTLAVFCFLTFALCHPIASLGQTTVTRAAQYYDLGYLRCAAYSSDGKYVLTAGEPGVFLWDAQTSRVVRMFVGHPEIVTAVAFSPDGTRVVTGGFNGTPGAPGYLPEAAVWNAADATVARTFVGHALGVTSVRFSPDGRKVLTGSSDNTAKLWDASAGSLLRTFSGHTGAVNSVAFSPDGRKVLTGSSDNTAKLWDASTGSLLRTFFGHTYYVYSVAFSPDGKKVLTGSGDNTAKLWDASNGSLLRTFFGHTGAINSVAFSPDGTKVLTGSDDKRAKLWDATSATVTRTFSGHTARVICVAFSPDGNRVFTASQDNLANLWNASDATVVGRFVGHRRIIFTAAFSPDGTRVLTGAHDERARLWDTATGAWIREFFHGGGQWVSGVAFSCDGKQILTGGYEGKAKLWDATGEFRREFNHGNWCRAVAFSPDGTKVLTSGVYPLAVRLWRISDGTLIREYVGHTGPVNSISFSPDGLMVLTASDDMTAKLWDAATTALIRTFSGHTAAVKSAKFSPYGTRIVTASADRTARQWSVSDGTQLTTFSGHTGLVLSAEFSPDGTRILTGSSDRTLRIWVAADGRLLKPLSLETASVSCVAVHPDGTKVVTGSQDGTAWLWPATVNTANKVILVSGGGNFTGSGIGPQTQALADQAFFTFDVRGCQLDEIQYLSAFDDWPTRDSNRDGLPDADDFATTQSFWSAIDRWASDAGRLFIYLIDHGDYSSQRGDYYFRLNATPQYIWARDLDHHLDDLQAQTGCEVILIVDCCKAGGFVQHTTGTRRIVIASTTPEADAIFPGLEGENSFSFTFLSKASLGQTLDKCFESTLRFFEIMQNPAGQEPWMDDNGDGKWDKWDGAAGGLASRNILGRYPLFGLNAPTILEVAPAQRALVGRPVVLWAKLDEVANTTAVWALILPKSGEYGAGGPVTELTRVNMTFNAATGRWQAAWSPEMKHVGECTVTYSAMSEDSLKTRLLAVPMSSLLLIPGATSVGSPWQLYP